MKRLNVYLNFPGNCAEALEFYKTALDGEVTASQTFGEAPMETADDQKDRIMHAEFKADGIYFMASDSMTDEPASPCGNVSLSINLDDVDEQTAIFDRLSAGGQVTMPLGDTFWGARFGMLVDKFGINWLLNCETGQK